MSKKNSLLPSGFADVLPPLAAQESRTVARLMNDFRRFGYEQVKPPIMEFESSLLDDSSLGIGQQTFRVMDPESQEMMAIRADMTTQINRIASTRLKDEPRPLRICYTGQVLRVKGEGLYAERQLAQTGAELIGVENAEADAESLIIAVNSVNNLGIKNISVDISLPTLPKILGAGSDLLSAISRKDMAAIKRRAGKNSEKYLALAAANNISALEKISKQKISKQAADLIKRVLQIHKLVKAKLPSLNITFDLLEHRGFEYYSGFSFSIFCSKNNEELGRGGRYTIGRTGETGCGFSLSTNAILRSLPKKKPRAKILVPQNTSLEKITALQKEGLITICSLSDKDQNKNAKKLGCKFILVNGKKTIVK